ncbi:MULTISPECIES: CPBP family intramembrane glutamic endopeptidase [unclassified Microbacterium]|uniref:CPBP family intramembrane glutamic endopeptidase n=1 Tax=unclassified Microbacterium TaxID=2609290 RepID=UPI000CFC89C1|nr:MULTISPECIES: type II CAAX endopeptidase family protein [unclassified Microbacterium]PQZ57431.1 CPBP family intramembrane metalloprotease domain-containing protein [Microbacterium sp. MYb43]PQZ75756.1 CPBP family intramembrane metalloprotease domain-containing protein [Microbacterium sp. MYb40]PRB22772.1 CPBP family intramembrane metalloprotease domain-containing protein [Microbacterium sp. MYb54]PRB28886.1 CPBP family intramembrane metalloprotease domain-containing protein [Microbacterium s
MNDQTPHARRVPWTAVIVFVAVSFALAWLVALPLWLGDGLAEPMSVFLLPVMMFTPAVAALVVTFVMRVPAPGQRARFLGLWPLRPAKRVIWLMVAGWLVPPLLVGLGVLLSAALGFVQLDLTFAAFAAELEKAVPAGTPLPPVQIIVFAQLAMIPVGGLFNSLFAFGEELGWRGWLLPALRPLGTWPALILSGVIWGVWHSPIILLGYNFGRTDITGVLFMIGGCVAWGVLLGWLRLRSASVWPAVIAHGSLNAAAGMIVIFAAAQPDLALAGPLGVAGWIVAALVVIVLVLTGQFRQQPELADAPGRLLSAPRS